MAEFPTGTVTFLFTDIEGSTALAQQFPAALAVLLARHHAIVLEAIEAHHSHVFQIIGNVQAADCAITMEQAIEHALRREGDT